MGTDALAPRVKDMLDWYSGAFPDSPEPPVGLIVDLENERRRLVDQIERLTAAASAREGKRAAQRLSEALEAMCDALDAYGRLDFEDIESPEWDALLDAEKRARLILRETGGSP